MELRYYDLTLLETLPESENIESDYPADLLLWEAYLAVDQFISPNLDLKLGRQRIAWGRADGFNPTDNLNPDDLTDFFDFGAKIPSWAIQGTYYLGESEMTAVWLPYFEPALLPRGGTVALFGEAPVGMTRPANTPGNAMYALKFTSLIFNVDYSLSYFNGIDDLPLLVPTANGPVMRFAEIEVLGFDFAGEYRSIGFRVEMAQFRPNEVRAESTVALSSEPYLKYTLGVDYTFRGGFFLEVQLVHGFITERGADNLGDFLVATIEQTFLNDELKLSVTGAFEARTNASGGERTGYGFFPELTYALLDDLNIGTDAFLLGGDDGSLFGRFRDQDQYLLKAKYTF